MECFLTSFGHNYFDARKQLFHFVLLEKIDICSVLKCVNITYIYFPRNHKRSHVKNTFHGWQRDYWSKITIFWFCDSATLFKSPSLGSGLCLVFRLDNTILYFCCALALFSFVPDGAVVSCFHYASNALLFVAIPLELPPAPVRIWCLNMLGCCHSLHQHHTLYSPTWGHFSQESPLQVRWIILTVNNYF